MEAISTTPAPQTSLEKALELCEALSEAAAGLSVSELSKRSKLPAPTVHRLLSVLKRCGYVRQDEHSSRYALTLKMLDLSFRLIGRSEIRLHAYPVLREYVLARGRRAFLAAGATGEVTYVWSTGPDAVAMHTVYGKEMPGHCAIYFGRGAQAVRRLSCLKLVQQGDVARGDAMVERLGDDRSCDAPRLNCTCAPVLDYTGRVVARVGVFAHGTDERVLVSADNRDAWELARLISLRLGHLPAAVGVAG
jgi:DNA-binding IclR family transcriptional regulator